MVSYDIYLLMYVNIYLYLCAILLLLIGDKAQVGESDRARVSGERPEPAKRVPLPGVNKLLNY